MPEITQAEFGAVAQLIQGLCGVVLEPEKTYLVQSRLGPMLAEFRADSYLGLLRLAQTDLQVRARVIDAITTHETMFFRHPAMFDLIRRQLIPSLRRRAQSGRTLDIWSAACSSGQEAYSLAMLVSELGLPGMLDCRIQGTDISAAAVEKASTGIYSDSEIRRGLDEQLRDRYCLPRGGVWEISESLKRLCAFRQQNLLEPFAEQLYDLVICANVAIYFSREDRGRLVTKLARHVRPGGFLLLGASEILEERPECLELREDAGFRYFVMKACTS